VRKALNPDGLAAPLGPYAHVTTATPGRLVFVAGQVALDRDGNVVAPGDIEAQTEQVMENIRIALEAAGATFADVVKITNYVTDASEYPKVAPIRSRYLVAPYPASALIEVSALLLPGLVIEIEAIAVVDAG
jgi:reactive intermediate/imine deaminase